MGGSIADERGQILVLAAVAIPVFLLLTALVVDSGNWFVHRGQLRTRADAGVHAAGLEYQRQWARCVSPGTQAAADLEIVAAAKGYAGATGVPSTYNRFITDVQNADIVVNGNANNPCAEQSPGVRWTELEVKERNIGSFFGSIPPVSVLDETSARARVELRPALSETGLLPLAIEDQRIVKAQARFFNDCTNASLAGPVTLTPLASQPVPGMTLWGSAVNLTLPDAGNAGFASPCPGSSFDYEPVTVQVRLASREEVDLNQSCNALIAAPFADCFRDVTQVRAFACQPNVPVCAGRDDAGAGLTGDRPLVFDVALGSGTCSPDAYYSRLPAGASSCTFGATVEMDWSDRPVDASIPPEENFYAELVVDGNSYVLEPAGPELRTLTTAGAPVVLDSLGPARVEIDWSWRSTTGTFNGDVCTALPSNPCDQNGTIRVHRTNLADNPITDTSPSDIVELARFSTAENVEPFSMFDSVPATGQQVPVYFIVGLRSELKPGPQLAALRTRFRTESSASARVLVCDPAYANGQTFTMLVNGCKPPYAPNTFSTSDYWWGSGSCPAYGGWFTTPYPNTPWRCIRTEAQPGSVAQAVADGIAARTGNCDPVTCAVVQCNTPNRYDQYYGSKTMPIDATDRRFITVYVVPFGAFKGPPDGEVPVLEFGRFYVTGWGAAGSNPGDPCPGNDNSEARPGRVVGYFVSAVGADTGPVDSNAPCDPNQLRPCRAVLAR